MVDEFYEMIASRIDDFATASDDGQLRLDCLTREYEERRSDCVRRKHEAERIEASLAARLAHPQVEDVAEIDREYNTRLQELSTEIESERRALQNRRDRCSRVLARIPGDLANTPIWPKHIQDARNTSDSELEVLLAQMADTSFLTWLKRLFHLKGTMQRDEACSLLKAMVQDEQKRIDRDERSMQADAEERQRVLQNEWSAKHADAERDARRRADAQAIDTSASQAIARELRDLEAKYEEDRRRLRARQESNTESERIGYQCRAEIANRVQVLGNADFGAIRQVTEFPRYTPIGMVEAKGAGVDLYVPYSFDWDDLQGCWFTVDNDKEAALAWIRAIVSTAIRCTPLGGLEVYWLDPTNAGLSLGKLADLSSRIERQEDTIIKVASTEQDTGRMNTVLENRTGDLGPAIASFGSLRKYNARANAVKAIPQTIVVVNDLSNKHFGTRTLDLIESFVRDGKRLGVQVLISCGSALRGDEKFDERLRALRESMTNITESWDPQAGRARYLIDIPGRGRKPINPINSALTSDELVLSVQKAQEKRDAANPTEVVDLAHVQVSKIEEAIELPVAVDELGNAVMLRFDLGRNVHGIVTGTTGSGKTYFLRNAIEAACTHYSPDDLEIWIIDYKRSEFAGLRDVDQRFPHIGLVAIDTSEDFIKVTIDRLYDVEMKNRQTLMVENVPSARDINEYNYYVAEHPELGLEHMRYLLVVIDEFHAQAAVMAATRLNKDDSSNYSRKFQNLIKECRAYGMHVLIADQSLTDGPNLQALGEKTVQTNMTNRVLLAWGTNGQEPCAMVSSTYSSDLEILGEGGAYIQHGGHKPIRCVTRCVEDKAICASNERLRESLGDACKAWDERFEYLDATRRDAPTWTEYCQRMTTDIMGSRLVPIGAKSSFVDPTLRIALNSNIGQNIFVLDPEMNLAFDLVETTIIGACSKQGLGYRVVVVAPENDPTWRFAQTKWQTLRDVFPNYEEMTDLKSIANLFRQAEEGNLASSTPMLIVVLGLEQLSQQMSRAQYEFERSMQKKQPSSVSALSAAMARYESHQKGQSEEAKTSPDDARELIARVIQWGPLNNVHICLLSTSVPNLNKVLGARGLDMAELFAHRFATHADRMKLVSIGMQSNASSLQPEEAKIKMVYHTPSGHEFFFRPYVVETVAKTIPLEVAKPLETEPYPKESAALPGSFSPTGQDERDGSEWLW